MSTSRISFVLLAVAAALFRIDYVAGQISESAPVNYTGIPGGDYSAEWQSYFQVSNSALNVDFNLSNNYAGNVYVDRANHPNNSLFFWAFEKENGSLTQPASRNSTKPWAIWLQGGPGTSSLYGLFTENGPMSVNPNANSVSQNMHAWSNLTDYIWVDQPVGVGYSTSDASGYANDEVQVGEDFVGFLSNLVKVFPSLATRPFYLTGESYAGRYIPYIAQALFSSSNPPVNLSKIMVGDPAFGSNGEFKTMPTLNLLETYPQLIDYNTDVYDYFKQQAHLCGLDLNVSYPQTGGNFPSINIVTGQDHNTTLQDPDEDKNDAHKNRGLSNRGFLNEVRARSLERRIPSRVLREYHRKNIWKRDLTGRANNSIDPWYGCSIWNEMVDYAVNFTYPWSASDFDTLDVPNALDPGVSFDPTAFLNSNAVKAAIHAPSQAWQQSIQYPWGSNQTGIDPSPEPMVFFDELATNMTNHGVQMIIYVGNDDGVSPHFGTEVTIQNTTFGGVQGFTRKPGTPWWDHTGRWSGIVHQERNWTYAIIYGAGHEVPAGQPEAAYTFVREFLVGNNQTGLVEVSSNSVNVVGGENPTLQQSVIPGEAGIAYGSTTTNSLTTWPTATVAAFESHVGLASITGTDNIKPTATGSNSPGSKSAALVSKPKDLALYFISFLVLGVVFT